MKISCCWLYAITKYGYPPSLADTFKVLREMKALGFDSVELEGVRRDNLMEVYAQRHELKKLCDGEGLRVINFCPVLPGTVSRSEEHTSELQSQSNLVCRLLLEKKKEKQYTDEY